MTPDLVWHSFHKAVWLQNSTVKLQFNIIIITTKITEITDQFQICNWIATEKVEEISDSMNLNNSYNIDKNKNKPKTKRQNLHLKLKERHSVNKKVFEIGFRSKPNLQLNSHRNKFKKLQILWIKIKIKINKFTKFVSKIMQGKKKSNTFCESGKKTFKIGFRCWGNYLLEIIAEREKWV